VSFEKGEAERLQSIPMKRLVEPAEVAEVFLLLVSPRVPSMTSVEIVLDGGASPYI
jgi:NAD(P)-dependent dehydrogenase (short-subunit alcohol dehydrogenase family)